MFNLRCKVSHLNGVQTKLKCKPNVKRCKRFVFPVRSHLFHHNALKTKAITFFQADHILTRFVFPPLENAIKDYLGPICKDYIDYYNYNGWGTISAVDCNQMEGLAEAVRSVILSNQDSLKNVDTADLQQYGKGSSNFKGYAYDMLQFIEKLCGGMAPDDFTQQLKKTVVYTGYTHDPTSSLYRIDGDNYSGMGMYIPNSFTTPKYLLWNNYFKSSIAWYHASGWAETESIWGN